MEIYVMRHGETIWNRKGITQGYSKNRLSEFGKRQVVEAREKYKDIDFDLIISSPMVRTVQTANLFNGERKIKIIKDNRLREIDMGIFTGRKFDSLSEDEIILKSERSADAKMESLFSLYQRVSDFVDEIKQKYSDKKLLIVTHGLPATYIEMMEKHREFDIDIYGSKQLFMNAEIKKIII